jgi:hypothetical protein
MTDADSNTPFEEHDQSIALEPDFDEYGLHEQDGSTVIIRIDHDTHIFERVGMIERRLDGVVLKQHTRLTDEISGDTAEVYQPIHFVSDRTGEFETQLWKAIFDLVYVGKVSKGCAEELSTELVESISQ